MTRQDERAALREELERMYAADQAIREEAMAVVREHGVQSEEYVALRDRGREQDAGHAARLRELVAAHGWPRRSVVGDDAARGAFFALQHADADTQTELLPTMREAVDAGEADAASLALLEDRVRWRAGDKQIYGTQIVRDDDGNPVPWPIEDEEHVDERRAAVGLEPMEQYLARFRGRGGPPPAG